MTTREKFVARFGEADARRIEEAARQHTQNEGGNLFARFCEAWCGPVPDPEDQDDPFLAAISVCIGWECLTRYAGAHGLELDVDECREWVRANCTIPQEYRDPSGPVRYAEYLGEAVPAE